MHRCSYFICKRRSTNVSDDDDDDDDDDRLIIYNRNFNTPSQSSTYHNRHRRNRVLVGDSWCAHGAWERQTAAMLLAMPRRKDQTACSHDLL